MSIVIENVIEQMTLEEKASLCSGRNFWETKPIERLFIPSIMMTDGPHGLRKQNGDADHVGLHDSVPATCFPSGSALASSWNTDLLFAVGSALGRECQTHGVGILLGPAVNLKRSPLCGRNFEYFSEDPYLASRLATHHILGVQSQGVGTSIKHFAANNQEHRRMSTSAVIDTRTLHELYLASFEYAIKQAKPWTVMCAYNRLNGTYCAEHDELLTTILRDTWGFDGFVVSDWGAVNNRVEGILAGLDLEMPGNGGFNDANIVKAVNEGKLSMKALDDAVRNLLRIIDKVIQNRQSDTTYSQEEHHQLARQVASECMVLLKNDRDILPLQKDGSLGLIGAFAKTPRYQGGGSSHVHPTKLVSSYDAILEEVGDAVEIHYAQGYLPDSDDLDANLLEEAIAVAQKVDRVVLFIGLPERYESEGFDRLHLDIPDNHIKLLEQIAKVQTNIVVVLSNGAPIEMPWIDHATAILEGYLSGQAVGQAVADLLFGIVNPSGKLAETFPQKLHHNPSHLNFPGDGDEVIYHEGVFIGYRYYEAKSIKPLFPFGHGLSYTTFSYDHIEVNQQQISDQDTLTVAVTVSNTGNYKGKEIIQLYVHDHQTTVNRPLKELKGFTKIELAPGEQKTVSFTLDKRSFAYFDTDLNDWQVQTGDFSLYAGPSSDTLPLVCTVHVTATKAKPVVFHKNSTLGDLLDHPIVSPVVTQMMRSYGQEMGLFDDLKDNPEMMQAMMRNMPLRGILHFAGGKISEEQLEQMIDMVNGLIR
nr:glycosyl hydrolase [Bacilli bacterium]